MKLKILLIPGLGKVMKIQGNGLLLFEVLSIYWAGGGNIPLVLIGLNHMEFIFSREIPLDDMHQPHSLLLWLLGSMVKKIIQ